MSGSQGRWLGGVVALLVLTGCTSGTDAAPDPPPAPPTPLPAPAPPGVRLPPPGGRLSYQLGGAYAAPGGTTIVARDRLAAPDPVRYSICYVNVFQAQPDEVELWTREHPSLLLRDADGQLVIDTQWDEPLLDVSTEAKRAELLDVVGPWLDRCAADGYQGVDADNLDAASRSEGLFTDTDALAFARLVIERGHQQGLAIAQKNGAQMAGQGRAAGFDFAIAEECAQFQECSTYADAYGENVLEIEYTDGPERVFPAACRDRPQASVVLRDRALAPAGSRGHVERWCG